MACTASCWNPDVLTHELYFRNTARWVGSTRSPYGIVMFSR